MQVNHALNLNPIKPGRGATASGKTVTVVPRGIACASLLFWQVATPRQCKWNKCWGYITVNDFTFNGTTASEANLYRQKSQYQQVIPGL